MIRRKLLIFAFAVFALALLSTTVVKTNAQEPSLENILTSPPLGFSLSSLLSTETFPAGTYSITMYAEYAGYCDTNELYWYSAGTTSPPPNSNRIFVGSDGVLPGTPGLVPSPLTTATKSFTTNSAFGLCLHAPQDVPDGWWFTETSLNIDVHTQHAKIYQSTTDPNLYFLGFENLAASGSDFDYNDMVVSLELTQYLTVTSPHGLTTGQGWYNAGSSASFSVSPTTVSGGTGIQYVFTGWSGTGNGAYTGAASSYTAIMNNPITETANWKTQYLLTVVSAYDTPTGAGWHDTGSTVTSSVTSPAGNEFSTGWTGTGSVPPSGAMRTVTFTITQDSTITWNWAYGALLGPSVGGQWAPITMQALTPINAFQLAPWIALAFIAAATAVAAYRRLLKKHW
jgi:hypothetical protein